MWQRVRMPIVELIVVGGVAITAMATSISLLAIARPSDDIARSSQRHLWTRRITQPRPSTPLHHFPPVPHIPTAAEFLAFSSDVQADLVRCMLPFRRIRDNEPPLEPLIAGDNGTFECTVCLDNEVSTMYQPCGHATACAACTADLVAIRLARLCRTLAPSTRLTAAFLRSQAVALRILCVVCRRPVEEIYHWPVVRIA